MQQRRQRPFAYVEFKDEAAMKEGMKRQGEVLKGETKPALEQADSNKAAIGTGEVSEKEGEERKERRRGRARDSRTPLQATPFVRDHTGA